MKNFLKSKFFTYGLFWSWNLLFLILFIALEIETGFTYEILFDGFTGNAPLNFTLTALLIYLIPFASIILAITRFRKERWKLVKLFYGVEAPLTLLCMLRLFLVRELNPGTTHLTLLIVAGMLAFFTELIITDFPTKKWLNFLRLLLHSTLLLIGIYAAFILLFYIFPIGSFLIQFIFSEDFLKIFTSGFLPFLGLIFGTYTATLFIGLPFALVLLYYHSFRKKLYWFAKLYGKKKAFSLSLAFLVFNLALFGWLNWNQPQYKLMQSLKNFKGTKEEIAGLSKKDEEIKEGLLNSYLASYRYLSEEEDNRHIQYLYKEAFGGNLESYHFIQSLNNAFLKPFLYEGESMRRDHALAESYYEKFFDAPIQKERRKEIKNALNSTWKREGVEAGLLNIDEKLVHVTEQKISMTEHGDWAEVEIYEVYQNQTFSQQEILYYFSLPENGVLTGLWISDADTVEKKYAFKVSPRGAAQQVYKNQVRRRTDPSILEQVGPGQYRLKAFPILPKTINYSTIGTRTFSSRNKEVREAPKFHLWLKYQVFADSQGKIPLPVALQRRNVYCDENTNVQLNKEEFEKEDEEAWLPITISMKKKVRRKAHLINLDGKRTVLAQPVELKPDQSYSSKSIAIIIDNTYSMKKLKKELEKSIGQLKEKSLIKNGNLFITGIQPSGIKMEALNDLIYFGNNSHLNMLHQFDSLNRDKKFDLAIFLTDQGSYELSDDSTNVLNFTFPVYMIHLDGKLPYAYDDNLLESITISGGKFCRNLEEMFVDWAIKDKYQNDSTFLAYDQGYLWALTNKKGEDQKGSEKFAAKHLIEKMIREKERDSINDLDKIHRIALQNNIVCPYSSMICLVTKEQEKELEEAEKASDRFKREVETGKEGIPVTSLGIGEVSGTPEPEEWALIFCAIGIGIYIFIQKRRMAKHTA